MEDKRNRIQDNDVDLQQFGKYLLLKQLVPERNAKSCVQWVRRFLERGMVAVGPIGDRRNAYGGAVFGVDAR